MKLIQKYFRRHAMVPLVMAITALSVLALLTQSMSTIDLIVENRQSAFTFLYITLLALPQLLAIILPIAVFIAILYALNSLNVDSEIVVAKAAGYSPWQLASPALRVGLYALILHLLINLFLQPFSQREMRAAILDVRSDLASQLVRPGEFNSPIDGLTVYASEILGSGQMSDVLIHDSRQADTPTTYTAKTGVINSSDGETTLIMNEGSVQYQDADSNVRIVGFDDYQFDMSQIMKLDPVFRLKASDKYLHELLRVDPSSDISPKLRTEYLAEGHSRLATPLYNIALVMIAICFLVRGEFKRMGYGKKIALAGFIGFFIRLIGFAMASAAEDDSSLNALQYGIPIATIMFGAWYMSNRNPAVSIFDFSGDNSNLGPRVDTQ